MTDKLLAAFKEFLDRDPSEGDMEKAFTFACGYSAGQKCAAEQRKLKLIEPSNEVKEYLVDIAGVLEATSFETHALWQQGKDHPDWNMVFEQDRMGGYLQTVACTDDHKVRVCVGIYIWKLNGKKILVVEPTSNYVDYELIEEWLKKYMPSSAYKGDRLNKTNASNAGNLR